MERFTIFLLTVAVSVQVTSQDNSTESPVQISKPKITVNLDYEVLYNTETVTLRCEVSEGPEELQYDWYKNSTDLGQHERSITASGRGKYQCKAKKGATESERSDSHLLTLNDPPKATLKENSKRTDFFVNEQVSFQCEIEGGSSGWTFQWIGDTWKSESNSVLSITLKLSDSGEYSCKGRLGNRQVTTQQSNKFQLTVKEPPQPQVQSDWTEAFPDEKVSLKCEIQDASKNWNYIWFKDSDKIVSNGERSMKGNTLTLSVKSSDAGVYECQAELQDRKVTTAKSTPYSLEVLELSQPNLSITSQWESFYQTEKVTLKCSVSEDSNKWDYEWFRNGDQLEKDKDISFSGDTLSISSAKAAHSGEYTCRGRHQTRTPVTTRQSAAVQLQILDNTPKPDIKKHQWFEPFYTKERVQLDCQMSGTGWKYQWYKGSNSLNTNLRLSIDSVSVTDAGHYHCKAQRGDFSVDSETLQVQVQNPPEPRIRSDWTEAFPGEKVSLPCVIKDVSNSWTYIWFKDSDKIVSNGETSMKGNTLTLSVKSSDAGVYECQAELQDRKVTTGKSSPHSLKFLELPQPNLSISSQWESFYQTEKVSLKCSVSEDSNKWDYEWFRNGDQLDKDKDISFSGDTLFISSAKAAHSGEYTCRGRHQTRTPVTTRQSAAVQLQILDNTPKPDIKKHQWFEPFYTKERVQLDCQMSGTGWKYQWYKGSNSLNTNLRLSIDSVSVTDAGHYHCKAQRGDFSVDSETLQVQVQTRPPALLSLETELGDIMTGYMTLRCNVTDGRQWNYTWFQDGQQLNASSDVLKVTGNEKTIKSEFKCKGINTVRPLYSALSDGFIANNILFKRKILLAISGCLVCCIVILIIGCIVLKVTRKTEVKETIQEDLFFSMTDSKNKTTSPMKEYMDRRPSELNEYQEKEELITDRASAVHEDGVIKDEDTPSSETNGLVSFKGH